jgi:hypothetical protein
MLQPFKMEVQQAKLEDVYEGIRGYPWFTLQQRVTAMPSPYVPPDFISAAGRHAGPPDFLNTWNQCVITVSSGTAHRRVARLGCVTSVTRRNNRQDLADRLDPVHIMMNANTRLQCFSRRSNFAWAKNALAV